jgi:hypothetical protein
MKSKNRPSLIEQLARKLKTPKQVQRFLKSLPYNKEEDGPTQRSAEQALRAGRAHCFEGAFIAAAVLELHGYPPLVLSIESQDGLDHVFFIYKHKGKWGSIAQSRDEGLHGRPAIYRTLRDLVWSYYDPYVDKTGKITAYQIAHLDDTKADWRRSKTSVFKAEKYLLDLPHRKLKSSNKRYKRLLNAYLKRGPMPKQKFWW